MCAAPFHFSKLSSESSLDIHAIQDGLHRQRRPGHSLRRWTAAEFARLQGTELPAFRLGCSVKTVKVHRGRVMNKMQLSSVADLVWIAAQIQKSEEQPTGSFDRATFPQAPYRPAAQLAS
jgi:hypothetical protein